MGVICEAIEKLVGEYLRDRGLVLWFDPERHYETVVARTFALAQDHLLDIRRQLLQAALEAEPFLRGLDPPKLLSICQSRGRRHRSRWPRCWRWVSIFGLVFPAIGTRGWP